ncbi:MAG: hypothetical protein IPK26_20335 [Planctomycetes bacterium]|nr:hypothetical protein [Planctomycetota bacterium]
MTDLQRPFFVLTMPAEASGREITERGADLRAEHPDDVRGREINDALDQLSLRPDDRVFHELFEPPGAAYFERERAWRRFVKKHKNNPIDVGAVVAGAVPPTLADLDLTRLLEIAFDGWLMRPGPSLVPAVAAGPDDVGATQVTMELHDVLFR